VIHNSQHYLLPAGSANAKSDIAEANAYYNAQILENIIEGIRRRLLIGVGGVIAGIDWRINIRETLLEMRLLKIT